MELKVIFLILIGCLFNDKLPKIPSRYFKYKIWLLV